MALNEEVYGGGASSEIETRVKSGAYKSSCCSSTAIACTRRVDKDSADGHARKSG